MVENYKVYVHIFPNSKKYIGITRQDINKRWQNGYGYKKQPIYNEILKFGWDNIEHIVLYENISKEKAREIEKSLIDEYSLKGECYNISKGGDCGSECWCEFEYKGKTYNAKELAEISRYNLNYHDITNRINTHKWSVEKAVNTPKQNRSIRFNYNGEYLTIKELYEKRINKDLTYNQIRTRVLKHHWDIERAITQPNNKKAQPKGVGRRMFEYNGKTYNSFELCQISKLKDLKPQDITDRINRKGWSVERAITQPKRKR